MKKFDRLPAGQRKEEICNAALQLFNKKGFAAVTMENIVHEVSLSKGGVYRLYPSTTAILSDLILHGMHKRNSYYEQRVTEQIQKNKPLDLPFLIEMILDSLLLYPEFSGIYVEFLWQKQRDISLQQLYDQICEITIRETLSLIEKYHASDLLNSPELLQRLTDMMNTMILGLHVLDLKDHYIDHKEEIGLAMCRILKI